MPAGGRLSAPAGAFSVCSATSYKTGIYAQAHGVILWLVTSATSHPTAATRPRSSKTSRRTDKRNPPCQRQQKLSPILSTPCWWRWRLHYCSDRYNGCETLYLSTTECPVKEMKKKLFLHIGMGKTGTTALQKFFWSNRRALKKEGILYPRYGGIAHAHHLLSPYIPPELKDLWKFKRVVEWAPKLKETSFSSILLSSELIAWATREQVIEFCSAITESFDLKVIIYLRRQDNMIMANYNQLVKAGSEKHELDLVLESQIAKINYEDIIEPWSSSIGKDNIIVRPYEKRQFYGGDICHDFMYQIFGIDISSKFAIPKGNSNPRFSFAAMQYKLQLNKLFENATESSQFNAALLAYSNKSDKASNSIYATQSILSPTVRSDILKRSNKANQLIAREFMAREDGILFYDPLPVATEQWINPVLGASEAKAITQYIMNYDRKITHLLVNAVNSGLATLDPQRREAANYIDQYLPHKELAPELLYRPTVLNSLRTLWTNSKTPGVDAPLLLVSVHIPRVTVSGYTRILEEHFGDALVRDYVDRPINATNFKRNTSALRKCASYAWTGDNSEQKKCVHGHFLPLKYRLLNTSLRKCYVLWMCNPVDRLISHYFFWKSNTDLGRPGDLHRKMVEENWSMEKFCLRPEVRNIYSKFLWGFPLRKFDFIGIMEFQHLDMERFSTEILDSSVTNEIATDIAVPSTAIDATLREKIERYHKADMKLYRSAIDIRRKQLTS
jgi:hypothetical protein